MRFTIDGHEFMVRDEKVDGLKKLQDDNRCQLWLSNGRIVNIDGSYEAIKAYILEELRKSAT